MRSEKEIRKGLKEIIKIYKKEFKKDPKKDKPLNINLYEMTVVKAIEKIVRATEICTINWILKEGGGLNVEDWVYKKVKTDIKALKKDNLPKDAKKRRS